MKNTQRYKNKVVWLKKFVLYNLAIEPFLIGLYLPYYILFLRYSNLQLVKWLLSTIPFSMLVGVVLTPVEMWLVRLLDRRVIK